MAAVLVLESSVRASRGTDAAAADEQQATISAWSNHSPKRHATPAHSCRADYSSARSQLSGQLLSAAAGGRPHPRSSPPPARSVLSDPLLEDLQRLATSRTGARLILAPPHHPGEGPDLDDRGSPGVNRASDPPSTYLSLPRSAARRAPRRSRRNPQALRTLASHSMSPPKATALLSFKGISEVYMVLGVTLLGITTLLLKGGLLGVAKSQISSCARCDGYGIEPCNICRGTGMVTWEGKLTRSDPCPLCFGSCKRKCRVCGGVRARKGVPPFLQQLVAGQGRS